MSTIQVARLALAATMGLSLAVTTVDAQIFYEGVDSGFQAPSGDTNVLPAGSKLMRLWDGGCALTEGVDARAILNQRHDGAFRCIVGVAQEH